MKKYFVAFLFLILLFPLALFAHGEGESYEVASNEFIVDIGYSEPAPSAGDSVSFDFKLRPAGNAAVEETPYSDVWVRIENEEGALVLATGVDNAEFGGARLTYMFLKEGTYTISARYEKDGESLADAAFPLLVGERTGAQENPVSQNDVLPFTTGFAVGAVFAALLASWKKITS